MDPTWEPSSRGATTIKERAAWVVPLRRSVLEKFLFSTVAVESFKEPAEALRWEQPVEETASSNMHSEQTAAMYRRKLPRRKAPRLMLTRCREMKMLNTNTLAELLDFRRSD